MKRLLAVVAPLLLALLVVGCGGPSVAVAPLHINGHVCSEKNAAMNCVLAKQPKPLPRAQRPAASAVAYGLDFGWSCPSLGSRTFGASYLSYDGTKNWTRGCVDSYHAHGWKTVAVWETGATRAADGCSAGASDAREAMRQLAGLGAPPNQPFTMAIDFDASGPQVGDYFRCASQTAPGRVNAYGGYRPLLWLFQHGYVGHLNWQTYAWSGGAWLPASIAPLEQYLNSSAVDYDRAVAANYAQWPYSAPNPGPTPAQVQRWIDARGRSLHAFYALCPSRRPVLGGGTCGKFAWRVNHYQLLIDTAHGYYPHCFGHERNLGAAVCQIVRPAVAIRSRARDATFQALGRGGCESARARVHNRFCNSLWQRYDYFNARAHHSVATSRL